MAAVAPARRAVTLGCLEKRSPCVALSGFGDDLERLSANLQMPRSAPILAQGTGSSDFREAKRVAQVQARLRASSGAELSSFGGRVPQRIECGVRVGHRRSILPCASVSGQILGRDEKPNSGPEFPHPLVDL